MTGKLVELSSNVIVGLGTYCTRTDGGRAHMNPLTWRTNDAMTWEEGCGVEELDQEDPWQSG